MKAIESQASRPIDSQSDKHRKIRVLIVDDSAFMRVALKKMLEADPNIEVMDVARNGEEALDKIRQGKPDIVTMDIEMPVMDGLTALDRIMKEMPLPVIMISALTEEGAEATFRALEIGAVDFIPKGGKSYVNLDIVKIGEQLRQKVRAVVMRQRLKRMTGFGQRISTNIPQQILTPPDRQRLRKKCDVVTIGISTGGPMALNNMLVKLPQKFSSSVLIVQHMPPTFTGPFSRRLDSICSMSVKEAEDGESLERGCVYIAPGGIHMKVKVEGISKTRICLDPEPAEMLFVPSVDVMMLSVAESYIGHILGVIMTGMGSDGLRGMTAIKKKGGITLAQDEASCVVYGMPKVCVEKGIIDKVISLEGLADEITQLAG